MKEPQHKWELCPINGCVFKSASSTGCLCWFFDSPNDPQLSDIDRTALVCINCGAERAVAVTKVEKPLTLSALTEEQAIQVAKLALGEFNGRDAHGFSAAINGAQTCVRIQRAINPQEMIVHIYRNFTVHLSSVEDGQLIACNTSNDRAIQKLFTEWGAE